MVAGHRRAASLLGGKFSIFGVVEWCVANTCFAGDDSEPDVRAGGNGAGRAPDRHWGGPVQDHEGGGVAADGVRAVPRQVHQGGQNDRAANA